MSKDKGNSSPKTHNSKLILMPIMLDKQGLILALLMGAIVYHFGSWQYLAIMLLFLFVAVAATKYENKKKRDMGIYEHERGWENVLSNGLLPTVLAILSNSLGPIPYIASVAAVTADKFGSELGVLSDKPISLENLKPTRPGKSGAISFLGLTVSLAGATLIGAAAIFVFEINPTRALFIGIAGFTGAFVDSIFGVLEERGIGTKGTTNFICSLTGALIGYYLIR